MLVLPSSLAPSNLDKDYRQILLAEYDIVSCRIAIAMRQMPIFQVIGKSTDTKTRTSCSRWNISHCWRNEWIRIRMHNPWEFPLTRCFISRNAIQAYSSTAVTITRHFGKVWNTVTGWREPVISWNDRLRYCLAMFWILCAQRLSVRHKKMCCFLHYRRVSMVKKHEGQPTRAMCGGRLLLFFLLAASPFLPSLISRIAWAELDPYRREEWDLFA